MAEKLVMFTYKVRVTIEFEVDAMLPNEAKYIATDALTKFGCNTINDLTVQKTDKAPHYI